MMMIIDLAAVFTQWWIQTNKSNVMFLYDTDLFFLFNRENSDKKNIVGSSSSFLSLYDTYIFLIIIVIIIIIIIMDDNIWLLYGIIIIVILFDCLVENYWFALGWLCRCCSLCLFFAVFVCVHGVWMRKNDDDDYYHWLSFG